MVLAKEKFASIRNKIMIRRTKQLIADQLPKKGQLFYHVCVWIMVMEQYCLLSNHE